VRCTIGYETPFISLREGCSRIAEALEAQGWPTKPNASFVALRQAQITLVEYDEAASRSDRMKNTANKNPAFAPAVLQAGRVLDEATRRLESAQEQQELSKEPPQPGSYEEATRQLDLACRDGAIAVSGDLVVKSAEGPVRHSGCEIPAAEIREVSVAKRMLVTDRGTVINVKFRIEDIDRIWPRPADNAVASAVEAPAISPTAPPPRGSPPEIANAMKQYVASESAAGGPANIDRAVSAIVPAVLQADRLLDEAKPRVERAHKQQELSKEPPQPGSYEEATRQLELACDDGAIAVSGDLVVKSAEGPVLQSECEIPAAEIREVSVAKRIFFTDGGTVINVNLRIEDIDKICPRPADNAVASAVEAPAISPSAPPPRAPQREIANALKRYLSSESAAGRPANIDRAVSSIKEQLPRATRSQIREIYRTEVPQPRGRPRKNRR
jgi:hypothetical protein